jgi:hypothetical protein
MTVAPDSNAMFQLSQPQRQFLVSATYTDGTQLDLTGFDDLDFKPDRSRKI